MSIYIIYIYDYDIYILYKPHEITKITKSVDPRKPTIRWEHGQPLTQRFRAERSDAPGQQHSHWKNGSFMMFYSVLIWEDMGKPE